MLPRLAAIIGILFWVLPTSTSAQTASCSDFDAWIWAQSLYEENPAVYAGLDEDSDGIACPSLPIYAFAPVLWTDEIPASAVPAQVTNIIDGDTFDVVVDGHSDRVRLYHIDAPETAFEQHCGGDEATAFLSFILQFAPNSTVYLEYDQTERDNNDRRLAYVWYELAGDVYLVNESMVRGGWAESETYRPDDKYKEELDAAEQFSIDKVLGVRLLCGRFGQEPGTVASSQQVRQAIQNQPNQGQFASYGLVTESQPPENDQSETNESQDQEQQQAPTPLPEPTPVPQPVQSSCDPNYSGCVPNVSYDLDCGDIGFSVQVLGYDKHGFDGDSDGWGCESF
jgi:endonuclease YncB( thermonuclease family)